MKKRKLHIAIPLMDELDSLPQLLDDIRVQEAADFKVFFCVNQPEEWWELKEKADVCERNLQSIGYIEENAGFPVMIIDRCSKGRGWKGKDLGVGWARKVAMDAVMEEASPDDLIITLDGDTRFDPGYFRSIQDNFDAHPEAVGLSVPYYHKLSGSEAEDRAILRYEIYMRNYVIHLWRIMNPYHYTALGSAMALPVSSYKTIGGMSPKKSGEDFYFLQKLVKYGNLLTWNEKKVYPAARFSDRVFFGTGPAMIKGSRGEWESYPIYHHSLFDEVKETYDAFETLYQEDINTPVGKYLEETLGQRNIWEPLRKNSRSLQVFRKACNDKIDGLRILQFLKHTQKERSFSDGSSLYANLLEYHPEALEMFDFLNPELNFDELDIVQLNSIRDYLMGIEENYQKKYHYA